MTSHTIKLPSHDLVVFNTWMLRNIMSAASSRPENRFRFKLPSLPPLQRLELGSNPRTFSNEATTLPTELKQMSTESVLFKWPYQEEKVESLS